MNSPQIVETYSEIQKESVGVGEALVDPQREAVQWIGIYFQGKFYLTDPYTYCKLQEVQTQIEMQKKIASSQRGAVRDQIGSVRSFENKLNQSGYSCATEHSPLKSKLKLFKAEKELQKQEEVNMKRMIQARNKLNAGKKQSKNLIQVKPRKDQQFTSQKQYEMKPQKGSSRKKDELNQSMMNKVQVPKNDVRHGPEFDNKESRQIEPQSQVRIILEQPPKLNQIKVQSAEGFPKQSVCKPVQPNKPTKTKQTIAMSQPKPKNQSYLPQQNRGVSQILKREIDQESEIVKRVVIENERKAEKEISILDLQSGEEQLINNQAGNYRAGNSFFNEINGQMYKLQMNLDGIHREDSQEIKKIIDQEKKELVALTNSIRYSRRQSAAMIDTKNILRQLNEQLQSMNFPLSSENKQDIALEKAEGGLEKEQVDLQRAEEEEAKTEKHFQIISKIQQTKEKLQAIINQQDKTPKPSQLEFNFKKKKQFSVQPSIINYQISSTVASKPQEKINLQEKEKLQQEISVLQQVIGELRVERLKYQVSQNQRSKMAEQSMYSAFEPTNTDINGRRLSETPSIFHNRAHGHFVSNFQESVVSEFQVGTRSQLNRDKSGKIVKNVSVDAKMTRIEEQKIEAGIKHTQENQKKITEQRQQSKIITEGDNIVENKVQYFQFAEGRIQPLKAQEKREQVKLQNKQNIDQNKQQSESKGTPKTKGPQYKIKITSNDSRRKSHISQPKSRQSRSRKGSIGLNQDEPLNNKSQRTESDLESSLPRAIINRHNHSVPPKITIEEQALHQKLHQQRVQKNLMDNFQKLQKSSSKTPSIKKEPMDPKRRAMREGLLKTIEYKTAFNPEIGKQGNHPINIKLKICEDASGKRQAPQSTKQHRQQSRSIKNFRMRKEGEYNRHSQASNGKNSHKSYDPTTTNKIGKDNLVYVPALNQSNFNNSTVKDKDSKLYELQFQFQQKQQSTSFKQGFKVDKRVISFTDVEVPKFPDPPHPMITVEQMIKLIRTIGNAIDVDFGESQMKKIIMKKYKNCIILDLPGDKNWKLVWHYSGKIYIGEWSESTMMKSGEGMEYIPQKYFYKGQFLNNKRNGTGIMIFQNGSRYEGQWLQDDRNGRGKYADRSTGLYYQGEWTSNKRDGYGYLQVQKRSIYEGTFSNNHLIGYGTEAFANGDSYKGEYERGKFHGKGVYVWASGSSYEGEFVDGKKHGQGKWRSDTGELYVGEYLQDKKHGFGRYKWQNGCIYEGQFANDKKNGKGRLKYLDGREVQGVWKDGELVDLVLVEDNEAPLEPKKSKAYETMTVIKVTQTKANKFSSAGRLSRV